jgi:hypothetical protein
MLFTLEMGYQKIQNIIFYKLIVSPNEEKWGGNERPNGQMLAFQQALAFGDF